jgi:hypothetical protein
MLLSNCISGLPDQLPLQPVDLRNCWLLGGPIDWRQPMGFINHSYNTEQKGSVGSRFARRRPTRLLIVHDDRPTHFVIPAKAGTQACRNLSAIVHQTAALAVAHRQPPATTPLLCHPGPCATPVRFSPEPWRRYAPTGGGFRSARECRDMKSRACGCLPTDVIPAKAGTQVRLPGDYGFFRKLRILGPGLRRDDACGWAIEVPNVAA